MKSLKESLHTPLQGYLDSGFSSNQIAYLLLPEQSDMILDKVIEIAQEDYPEVSEEQAGWDLLTRLEENLRGLEEAEQNERNAHEAYFRASTILEAFLASRDQILSHLYDQIKDRFVALYRDIHGTDEAAFDATLAPDEAALKLQVDFYGHGLHPPHALHSEGHQDSMGLCLYLALAEQLTRGVIDLVILDDVVMSVDANHRKQICSLLTHHFPDRQFLVTTHDQTWARQLRASGVVDTKGSIEFYSWDINAGPSINYEVEVWDRIKTDLEMNDVPSAAQKLRRASEDYFRTVCEQLQASVVFKQTGQWELGDLLFPAIERHKELINLAIKASQARNEKATVEKLQEQHSIRKQIASRTNAEFWAVNAAVHYNNWASLSKADFIPVVEAFQDLFTVFQCNECHAELYVVSQNKTEQALRCKCGNVNWNLMSKS